MKHTDALSREEKLLLLLQMFIERLKKSGFSQDKIIRYMWLFCVGYYIKYYLPQSKTDLADRFTIISMLSNALKSSSSRIIQQLGYEHEITFFFRFMIHYAIDNEGEAENIYREERVKYEKAILFNQVITTRKKRRGKRF
ncbi:MULTISPECIES: hypothetical protein [Pantoea]|uniref:Uncharacterized protein n=1 Tax=Pantoea allii TaxID=574096 RepID=A0ABS6VEV5_9GAMM|nr:hypothetical protein [Pantoea allii]MBW1214334.1 hypothetical protein [Pantoea allii]MBW1257616.1 hypothetical protein [Pantoea allii]MBW1266627.1 hypothetical protein [Pantoea allii]MBW1288790.1 hypothetical protein [Pantoea allii]